MGSWKGFVGGSRDAHELDAVLAQPIDRGGGLAGQEEEHAAILVRVGVAHPEVNELLGGHGDAELLLPGGAHGGDAVAGHAQAVALLHDDDASAFGGGGHRGGQARGTGSHDAHVAGEELGIGRGSLVCLACSGRLGGVGGYGGAGNCACEDGGGSDEGTARKLLVHMGVSLLEADRHDQTPPSLGRPAPWRPSPAGSQLRYAGVTRSGDGWFTWLFAKNRSGGHGMARGLQTRAATGPMAAQSKEFVAAQGDERKGNSI